MTLVICVSRRFLREDEEEEEEEEKEEEEAEEEEEEEEEEEAVVVRCLFFFFSSRCWDCWFCRISSASRKPVSWGAEYRLDCLAHAKLLSKELPDLLLVLLVVVVLLFLLLGFRFIFNVFFVRSKYLECVERGVDDGSHAGNTNVRKVPACSFFFCGKRGPIEQL